MAKQKSSSRPFGQTGHNKSWDHEKSKLAINTFEDVADSEDEFHINRDKILLEEGPAQKRQRISQEEDALLEPSDEEVLVASPEDTSEYENDFEDAEEEEEEGVLATSETRELGNPEQDFSSGASAAAEEEEEDIGGWGNSRKDYYDADAIETEGDAIEEEAEARRLQQKQLQGMTEADFGLDEVDWLEGGMEGEDKPDNQHGNVVREVLPKLEITDAMGPEERKRILRMWYPEFELLAKEFLELQAQHGDLKVRSDAAERKQNSTDGGMADPLELSMPVATMKYRALSAYLAALSMYFALLSSGSTEGDDKATAMPPEELRDHTVMDALVECRDIWVKVKDIEAPELATPTLKGSPTSERGEDSAQVNGQTPQADEAPHLQKKAKSRKSKSQRVVQAAQLEAETIRRNRIRETEASLADLSALTSPLKPFEPTQSTARAIELSRDSDSDIGDQTTLTASEAAEKAKRKKSLRFYTSQIAQKSNKRDVAGRDAGGDADLPYRERLKDRQARLNVEAEKRGLKGRNSRKDTELGGESDDDDDATARQLRDARGGSEDYYDFISSRVAKKKEEKAALSVLQAQAGADGGVVRVVDQGDVGEDGKRAISYAIEKNKGLVGRRKKEVRNPRVKKRKKFEEKKKKLGSVRQVYKGGEGRGGYAGELTGIKKGLVKGIRL
ncbi:MAG: hypothetical protein Q9163_004705 [Psora crenata]